MDTPNLKRILETLLSDQPQPMSKQEKMDFMESVKNFSALGESVYGKDDIDSTVSRVKNIVETAQKLMTEKADWFESVSLKREMKRLQEDYDVFESTMKEMKMLRERVSMAYENIGHSLGKYYDV